MGITGDTAYYPPIIEQVKNSDLLIHEASLGPCTADPEGNKQYLHSGSEDAGRVAAEAQVERLFMVRATASRGEACVQAAAKYFEKEIR